MIIDVIVSADDKPEPLVDAAVARLLEGDEPVSRLQVSYLFAQYWLPGKPVVQLTAYYAFARRHGDVDIEFTVSSEKFELDESSSDFRMWCQQHGLAVFTTSRPLSLEPIKIPKPWGQEIWFTGVEERGVVFAVGEGGKQLLPYILSALPNRLSAGCQQELILLKILDPLPEPVFGDLYFELHQQKREVYVVTHVDERAWPDKVGAIRFGFNAAKRALYSDDAAFKQAFAQSVRQYEAIRRQLDDRLDELRIAAGYQLNEPVSAQQVSDWLLQTPVELRQQEIDLRQHMDAFTDTLPLTVGDVVKVPCLTPHALQHGVRTVEFQTPVYERLILSFAQKVLTQAHWDTAQAVELMNIESPQQQAHQTIFANKGVAVDRIVDFEDFEVQRVVLGVGEALKINSPLKYGLLMSIDAGLKAGEVELTAEQALLLPGSCSGLDLYNPSSKSLSFLLAYPK
ncbi:hypothetical protein [Oceanicoccus sp. KOV_DT_Chl]|uniref:hypothetical protein n=1 Tax=Oceanicoccus sp. KOV_DT_Chl TaxID=1904639 RepID=UPI000C7B25BE|nr:hypothetical protein [Oceanicoccus sp. KOV_DT_Chl]